MTPARRRAIGRWILAAVLALCWHIHAQMARSGDPSGAAVELARGFVTSPLTAFTVGAALLLIAFRSSLPAYGWMAFCVFVANWTGRLLDPSHIEHSVLMPDALCFFMFFVLLLRRGAAEAEDEAWELGCVLIAAMYFLAGIEKIATSGFSWLNGETVRALAASESMRANGWLQKLRWEFACDPIAGRCASVCTILVELIGAPAFVVKRLRPWAGGAIVLMHAGIVVFGSVTWNFFPLLILVLSVPDARPRRR